MNKQPPKPQKQEIKIADNIPGAEYTNMVQINHTQEEFQTIFMNVLPPSGKVVSKIITSPGHFKRMVKAMQENLEKYEDRFGEIKTAPGIEKEIGFKG
jgi:23S rRNA U2552 (ribose-2'-O)-methylase RlmE/FtsJ